MQHEKFTYKSLDELKAKAESLKVHLPFSEDISVLAKPLAFGNVVLKNRLGIAPMEGADALPDGSPSGLLHAAMCGRQREEAALSGLKRFLLFRRDAPVHTS